jgi:hypothetical protein
MKKWILPLLAAVLLTGSCGILGNETMAERRAREDREAQFVDQHVKEGDFTIRIDRMYPLRGTSRSVSSYSVSVRDGMLLSHLPYIGQAWRVPYGGGHALNFDAKVDGYQVKANRKDGYEILVHVQTDEDRHTYTFTIFNNGRASLDVHSGNRERISFSGTMDFDPEER